MRFFRELTLIELMVIVIIIGVLSALFIPRCMDGVTVEVGEPESNVDSLLMYGSCGNCGQGNQPSRLGGRKVWKASCDTATTMREGEFELIASPRGYYSDMRWTKYEVTGDTAIMNKALGKRLFFTIKDWRVVETEVVETTFKEVTETSKDEQCQKQSEVK